MGKRRKFSAEFKREAVALTAQPDVSVAQGRTEVNRVRPPLAGQKDTDPPGARTQNLLLKSQVKSGMKPRQFAVKPRVRAVLCRT